MATAADLINRMYREFLSPPNDSMLYARLNGAHNNSTTTIAFNVADNILTPEEIDLLGEGVLIEINSELMLITAWSSPNATVVRGWGDTDAAAHADGDIIYIAPWVTRKQVFDSLKDAIVDLGAELEVRRTTLIAVTAEPNPLPVGCTQIEGFQTAEGFPGGTYRFLPDWPPSSSGVAVHFLDVAPGTEGWLTYYSRFPRPTAETDDLTDTNDDWAIPEEWFKIILVDALATLVVTKQTDQMSTDFVTELLAQEGFDISESRDIVRELLGLRDLWIDRHRRRRRQTSGIEVEMLK